MNVLHHGCSPEKFGKIRRTLCVTGIILNILNFLCKYIPQLKHLALPLLGVKVLVKGGDKYAEYNFSYKEKKGREFIESIRNS